MYFHGDKLTRQFLWGGSTIPKTKTSSIDTYQEPTFLTFGLFFVFNTFNDINTVTSGLLLDDTGNSDPITANRESSIRYLKRIGEFERAQYLKEFRDILKNISENQPWFFDTISGVNDLWKIQPGQNFRGKEKVLTIECHEGLDLRITALMDLYRKAWYDASHEREILIKSKKRFTCELLVFEYRKFTQYRENAGSSSSLFAPITSISPLPGGFGGNNVNDGSVNILELMTWMENYTSCIHFVLENCEFDMSDFGLADQLSSAGSLEPARQRFKIKVGKIREQNRYSLLGYLLTDSPKKSIIMEGLSGKNKLNVKDGTIIDDYEPLVKPTEDNWEDFQNYAADVLRKSKELGAQANANKKNLSPFFSKDGPSLLDRITSGEVFTEKFWEEVGNKGLEYGKSKYDKVSAGIGGVGNLYDKIASDPLGSALGLVYDTNTGRINKDVINVDNLQRAGVLLGISDTAAFKNALGSVYDAQATQESIERVTFGDTNKEIDGFIEEKAKSSRLLRDTANKGFNIFDDATKKAKGSILGSVYDSDSKSESQRDLSIDDIFSESQKGIDDVKKTLDEEANVGESQRLAAQRENQRKAAQKKSTGGIGRIYPDPAEKPKPSLGSIDKNAPTQKTVNLGSINTDSTPVRSGKISINENIYDKKENG